VLEDTTLSSRCQIYRTLSRHEGQFRPKRWTVLELTSWGALVGIPPGVCYNGARSWEYVEGINVEGAPGVGLKIRELREQRNLSLRALAEMCNVSPNTVSLIERGLSSPSVDTLQRLASGLRVPIVAFFESGDSQARLILMQSANRTRSRVPGMMIEHLGSGLADHAFASFLITMEPGISTNTTPIEHSGAEWVYCLEGLVEYEVEGRKYRVAPGDNLLFDASLPHRWRNPGPEQAQMLLILDAGERHDLTVEQHLQI
jgi:transcriptional regulator with XRE-family HTH domain